MTKMRMKRCRLKEKEGSDKEEGWKKWKLRKGG
jgi:hypothetical protein